ncbi:MAG: hypothetical protein QXN59_02865 [Candidatus Micrarchaeaceae archaeon]
MHRISLAAVKDEKGVVGGAYVQYIRPRVDENRFWRIRIQALYHSFKYI